MRSTSRDEFGRRVVPNSPEHLERAPMFGREAIAARLDWWTRGAPGHYPGCPCAKCDAPPPVSTDALVAAWAAIAPAHALEAPGGRWRRRTIVSRTQRRRIVRLFGGPR